MPSSASFLLSRRAALRRGGAWLLGAGVLGESLAARHAMAAGIPSIETDLDNDVVRARRAEMAERRTEHIALGGGLHVFSAPGVGNVTALATNRGVLVVDSGPGLPPAAERLQRSLREVTDRPLRYVVNTHWHFDHTDGNASLSHLGATIVAHRNVRQRLSAPKTVGFFNLRFGISPEAALPTVTFDQEMELHLGGESVHLRHIAASHTDGDTFVHWPRANVIATGDLFFSGTFPFIDGESGGRLDGLIRATEVLLTLTDADTRIVPGHGPVSGRRELVATLEMLRTTRERVGALRSRGLSIDEAVAAEPLADLDPSWERGFVSTERFTRLVYSLLDAS